MQEIADFASQKFNNEKISESSNEMYTRNFAASSKCCSGPPDGSESSSSRCLSGPPEGSESSSPTYNSYQLHSLSNFKGGSMFETIPSWKPEQKKNDATSQMVDIKKENCYPPLKKYTKEEKVMSFGGIIFLQDTLIGFADRKASLGDMENPYRPEVQKLFWNEKFITVMTGTNSFKKRSSGKIGTLWLEDWMKKHIIDYDTPMMLYMELWNFVRNQYDIGLDFVKTDSAYFPEKSIYPVSVRIDFNSNFFNIEYLEEKQLHVAHKGSTRFVDYFNLYHDLLYTYDENEIRKTLKIAFEKIDIKLDGEYNPVGNEWNIHTFSKPN